MARQLNFNLRTADVVATVNSTSIMLGTRHNAVKLSRDVIAQLRARGATVADNATRLVPKWVAQTVDTVSVDELEGVDFDEMDEDDFVDDAHRGMTFPHNGAGLPTSIEVQLVGSDDSIASTVTLDVVIVEPAVRITKSGNLSQRAPYGKVVGSLPTPGSKVLDVNGRVWIKGDDFRLRLTVG